MTDDTTKTQAKQAQDGNAEALSTLVEQLRAPLFAIAYRELRHYDNAQDAVANALLRVLKYLPGLREPSQVQAWASRIARNEARRLMRPPDTALPEVADEAPPDLLRLDVERELRRLPRDQARASALFYFEGYSVAQIAQELGRPEGTVKYWLHRTRGQLRQRLREDYLMVPTITPNAAPVWTAIVAGEDFAPATVADVERALYSAGWSAIHPVTDALVLATLGQEDLAPPLSDCRLVVLGEQAAGRSAFEWSALWRARRKGQELALLLIADGSRPETEFANTAMAAYVAGFDMLLSRPFAPHELESFAHRIRTTLEQAPPKSA